MKKKLEARLAKLRSRYDEVTKNLIAEENADARTALGNTLRAIQDDITETEEMLSELNEQPAKDNEGNPAESGEGGQSNGQPANSGNAGQQRFNPISSMTMRTGNPTTENNNNDPRATIEYRTAFMEYVKTGKRSEVLNIERRSDDQTELPDLGVLIPTTTVNEIIKGVEKVYGQLYSKVKKTNIKGGIKYPIGSFSATFNRIYETVGDEGTNPVAPTDRQNGGSVSAYVEFGYKIGEIRLAQTLLMSIMNVDIFEAELSKVIVEAYVEAMDKEIISGNPSNNQMCGILNNSSDGIQRIDASHIISFSPNDMLDWKTWQTKLFAKIPLSMRSLRPEFVMTANTFESNIETLEDSNGQPVARNIYNPVTGDETATFKGRTVTFVEEDIFPNFNDASNNAYFGMYWVADKAYGINSNLEFAVRRYFDEEKNMYVDKAIIINDGKILDPKYIFLLKKVANS